MQKYIKMIEGSHYPIRKFDVNGHCLYYENEDGFWYKQIYNENGYCTYYENSNGHYLNRQLDNEGFVIYATNHEGKVLDCRKNYEKYQS